MWIKLCGIRDLVTANLAAELGADAIGLNFFQKSPRSVTPERARELRSALPETVDPVGLFVNHSLADVAEIASYCGLRTLQLHGDETPEFLAELTSRLPEARLIRAFRVENDFDEVLSTLAACERLGVSLWGCLIDARVSGHYGGTGHTAPWDLIARCYPARAPSLILAGGLVPENVAESISAVRPWGVDVSSGIESAPGVKSPERMRAFVAAARGTC